MAQSIPISYHAEGLVKTKVTSTMGGGHLLGVANSGVIKVGKEVEIRQILTKDMRVLFFLGFDCGSYSKAANGHFSRHPER